MMRALLRQTLNYVHPGLRRLARKGMRSFRAGELRQASTFSTLSKTVTTTRFGASPSNATTLPPRVSIARVFRTHM